MTAPVLTLPVKFLRSAVAGRRPGDGNFRPLTDGDLFVNTYDKVACYLNAAGGMITMPFDTTLLAPLASPALTGTPTAPTPAAGDNSTIIATTAFVRALTAVLAPLASPAITGTPTAPTAVAGDSSGLLATTAFVSAAVTAILNQIEGGAPAALSTLKELADAIADNPSYAAATASALAQRLRLDAAGSYTAAQQQQGLANLGLTAPISGFRNRLLNPGFRVNQRSPASTGAALAAGVYGHDRWRGGGGGCTYGTNAAPGGPETYIIITAGTLQQAIEAAAIEGGTYTLSWAGTAVARLSYTNTAGNATTTAYAASPMTVTDVKANTAVTVEFYFNAPSGTVQNPQFEPGPIATPYERRPYTTECLLCYRYYRVFPYRVSAFFDVQTANAYQFLYFHNDVDFRVTPSIVGYADDQGTAGQVAYIGSAGGVLSRAGAYSTSVDSIRRANIAAYPTSRNAHGCSLTLTAEL